jgi:hypothetical protein
MDITLDYPAPGESGYRLIDRTAEAEIPYPVS